MKSCSPISHLVVGIGAGIGAALTFECVKRHYRQLEHIAENPEAGEITLRGSEVINRPTTDVYAFWRQFENLSDVMPALQRVEEYDDGLTYWKLWLPMGRSIEWISEVVDDVENKKLSWQSIDGSDIDTWGSVNFFSIQNGAACRVVLNLKFTPRRSSAGARAARALSTLEETILNQYLKSLKRHLEGGPGGGAIAEATSATPGL